MKGKILNRRGIGRVISIVLCLAICLSLVPTTVYAASDDVIQLNGKLTGQPIIGGTIRASVEAHDILADEYLEGGIKLNESGQVATWVYVAAESTTEEIIPATASTDDYIDLDIQEKWAGGTIYARFETTDGKTYSLMPVTIYGVNKNVKVKGLEYEIEVKDNNCEATLVGPANLSGDIVIPEKVFSNGIAVPVTAIKDELFCANENITSVTMPNTVKKIGNHAFIGCKNLKSLVLSNNLDPSDFDENMISVCINLEKMNIPATIETIPNSFFFGITTIKEITIPSSIKSIAEDTFKKFNNLEKVVYRGTDKEWNTLITSNCAAGNEVLASSSISVVYLITKVMVTGIPTPIIGQPCTTEGYDSLIEVSTEDENAISKVSYEWVEDNGIGGFFVDETCTFRDGEDEYGYKYKYDLYVSIELNEGYEFSSEVVYGRKSFAGSISVDGDELLNNAENTRIDDGVLIMGTKLVAAQAPTTPGEGEATPVPTTPGEGEATPAPTTPGASEVTPAPTTPGASEATPAPTTPGASEATPVPTTPVGSEATPVPSKNPAGEVSEDNNTITITGNGKVQATKYFEKAEANYDSKVEWLNATNSTTKNKWMVTVKNESDKTATVSFDVLAKSTLEGQKLSDSLLTNTDTRQKLTASGIYMDKKTETVFNFVPEGDDLHATKEGISIAANSSMTFNIYFLMGETTPATKTFAFLATVGVKAELASDSGNPSDSKDPSNNPTFDPIDAQHYENGVTNDHMNRYSIKGDKCIVAVRDAAGAYRGGETFYIYDGVSNTLVGSFVMEENSAHTHTVLCVPGQTYKFAISDKLFTTEEEIKAFCAKGTTEAITIPDKAALAEPYLQWEPQTPAYTLNTATITVKRPLGTMVDVYRDGKLITTIKGEPNKDGESSFVDKGLAAATSYKYKLVPCFVDNDVKWECTPKEYTVKTATAAKAFLNITKFDSNTVNITIAPNRSHVANGEVTYKIYDGKKLLKTFKEVGKKAIIYKYKKKGAAKKKFKVVTVCNTNKKLTASSPVRKSQKNTYKRTWGNPSVSNMKSYSEAYYPTKVTSDGKKVTVTGYLLNSHIVAIKETGYINVYYDSVDGSKKYLGKKKVKATIANRSKKKVSFTIKLKKQLDVKNGSAFYIDSSKIEWKY